jgi:FG-GAP-like repeat/Beta-galactosidase
MPALFPLKRSLHFIPAVLLATAASAFPKSFPAGIVDLTSNQITANTTSANLVRHAWSNQNVRGMRLKTTWNYVQPTATTYDWSALDETMRLGTENGKFIGLSVTAGTSSPQWVYDIGATKYTLRDGSGLSMPLPWDPVFQNQWISFIRALGQRYDANPALGYVVISGLGQQIETYLAKTAADDSALTPLGGAPAWITAAKTIISAYAQAFPTTPFFLTMARPFPSTSVGVAALQEVVNWAIATYPRRFGLMTASLSASSSTGYYPNAAIFAAQSTQPTGFQMLCAASDTVRLGGTLEQALTKGAELGGHFVEVYEVDVQNPAQQATLAGNVQFDPLRQVLWQNDSTGARAIWLMSGTQRTGQVELTFLPISWDIAATGDFNGDGKTDLIWQNNLTGECRIWLMNGMRASGGVYLTTVGPAWKIVSSADFNGDGQLDILWQNSSTGNCIIWLMNGTRMTAAIDLGSYSLAWKIVGAADFNGDRKPDIVWQNSVTGLCAVWLMNGTNYSRLSTLGTVDTSWKIVGTADFNGDGKRDILWQNRVTNECGIWLMNGTQRIGIASLGIVPASWEIRNH